MHEEWKPFVDRDEEDISSGHEGVMKYCGVACEPQEEDSKQTAIYASQVSMFEALFPAYQGEIVFDQSGVPHVMNDSSLCTVESMIAAKLEEDTRCDESIALPKKSRSYGQGRRFYGGGPGPDEGFGDTTALFDSNGNFCGVRQNLGRYDE